MKEKTEKKCSLLCSFYDRTRIVEFLEKQAEEGWLLDKLTSLGSWHFHRIEPKKIRFSVVYMKNASMFDPEGTDAQKTLADYCAHEGWTFAVSNAQMQVFYSENPDAAPIVTDAAAEIASIRATMKRTYLPVYWLWIFLAFFNIFMKLLDFGFNPVKWLSTSAELLTIGCWLLIALVYGAKLIEYASWRHRAKKAASLDGSFIRTGGLRFFSVYSALLACLSLLFSLTFVIGNSGVVIWLGTVLLIVFGVLALLMLSDLFRRLKYARWLNRVLTVGLLVLLTVGIISGMIALIVAEDWNSSNDENVEIHVTESGYKEKIYHDELPLTVADLTGTDYERDSKEIRLRGTSLLAHCLIAREDARLGDPDQPELSYTVVSFRTPIGYRACRAVMLRDFTYDNDPEYTALKIDAAPWGADEAYQLKHDEEEQPRLDYLLCYGDTIVEIDFDFWKEEPTDAQKAIVGETLGEYGQKE